MTRGEESKIKRAIRSAWKALLIGSVVQGWGLFTVVCVVLASNFGGRLGGILAETALLLAGGDFIQGVVEGIKGGGGRSEARTSA